MRLAEWSILVKDLEKIKLILQELSEKLPNKTEEILCLINGTPEDLLLWYDDFRAKCEVDWLVDQDITKIVDRIDFLLHWNTSKEDEIISIDIEMFADHLKFSLLEEYYAAGRENDALAFSGDVSLKENFKLLHSFSHTWSIHAQNLWTDIDEEIGKFIEAPRVNGLVKKIVSILIAHYRMIISAEVIIISNLNDKQLEKFLYTIYQIAITLKWEEYFTNKMSSGDNDFWKE